MSDSDTAIEAALTAVFSDRGKAAVYTPAGGEAMTITVLLRHPDRMVSPAGIPQRAESPVIEMLVSEVASPKKGDAISIGDEAFYLSTPRHPDPRRLKWEVELNRA